LLAFHQESLALLLKRLRAHEKGPHSLGFSRALGGSVGGLRFLNFHRKTPQLL
jgi:hypothetical protein